MLFNSVDFGVFFPLVFILYWLVLGRSRRVQNVFLLVASYVFYGWWDYRFLSLIFISSLVDYVAGARIGATGNDRTRRLWLGLSVAVNLGLLGFFKYFNFFTESAIEFLNILGLHPHPMTLNVILPVGISFYTFQTMTYSIDIYRGHIKPTKDPIAFFAYVAFFPQLVAGPIERAGRLLPQFLQDRRLTVDRVRDGLCQMLWGFFKKMVIADNVAQQVDWVFSNYQSLDGVTIAVGAFLFAIQIYCDFAGYSDIAIGTARLLGFDLMRNFAYPYFSRNIAEFWRRWHISLSTWFRDYMYIPLGGNRCNRGRRIFNVLATFTVCGFWHGANWTFLAWGFLNGLYYVPLILLDRLKPATPLPAEGRLLPRLGEFSAMALTFGATVFGWIFFRSATLGDAGAMIARLVTHPYMDLDYGRFKLGLGLSLGLLALEWLQRGREYALQLDRWPFILRYAAYYMTFTIILILGSTAKVPFLYFQF